jgi:hypothetical protein
VVAQLDHCFTALNSRRQGGPCAYRKRLADEHSQPVGIPGGTCGFDLPAYYAWQHKDVSVRQHALEQWASTLAPLAESIYVLLKLLRDTGVPQKVAAERGQFQQNLPQGRTFQLLRLRIDPALGLIPEISGNRLIVSVRLMRQEPDGRLHSPHRRCRVRADALRLKPFRPQMKTIRPAKPACAVAPARGAVATASTASNRYRPFCSERCKQHGPSAPGPVKNSACPQKHRPMMRSTAIRAISIDGLRCIIRVNKDGC